MDNIKQHKINLDDYKMISDDNVCPNKYYVSKDGEIISMTNGGKILKQREDKDGYMIVSLYSNKDGYSHPWFVHRLVLMNFGDSVPDDYKELTVDHKDYNRKNNSIDNLQWMERKDNSKNRKDGAAGEHNGRAKLSESDVKKICKLILKGETDKEIAEKYNVANRTIRSIRDGKNWKSITKDILFKENN